MSTRSSPCPLGHATVTEPRKPSTRTVAHRKVYGKRRKDAARAVLEDKRQDDKGEDLSDVDGSLDTLRTRLADVTIHESLRRERPSTKRTQCTRTHQSKAHVSAQLTKFTEAEKMPQLRGLSKEPLSADLLQKPVHSETMTGVQISSEQSHVTSIQTGHDSQAVSVNATPSVTKRKPRSASRRISGLVHDARIDAYVRPVLDEALSSIASQGVQTFSAWASRSESMFHVVKLAEGSYGEVYKLRLHDETSRPPVSKSKLAKLRAYGDGVFKVVPLCAPRGPGSKKYTSVAEIVSEVKLLKYLDPIPGFARFREIHVVQGRFPELFQRAWDHYKATNDDCWNPDPSNRRAFPETQLWAIIEMDDAGHELEKFAWSSIFQIYDIFWGVAMALARAEEYAMFEHRDLHLGNICIRSTRADGSMDPPSDLEILRRQSASGFGFSALETTIIDYSLSRADLQSESLEPEDNPDSIVETASSDLDKRQIFDAVGEDEDEALLRDTYRYMRNTVYTGAPLAMEKYSTVAGIWKEYVPQTNLIWLLFLLKILLKNRKAEPSQVAALPERVALAPCSPNRVSTTPRLTSKTCTSKKTEDQTDVAKKSRARDLHLQVSKLEQTLENRLKTVLDLLDLNNGHDDMCCAADLVAYALDSHWLAKEDFF
ncbi:hypothetical protein N7539_007427 [Penicillium diatomitis]|uniref:Uncharacterized protein n=1 Tax=Penicillium diatomitis TaxID=2819901 RepID=A0A9W9WV43_9EURO|nr:uncharacterized protein N7539_007427 [Penicillium diatomitis]KAJ5477283.1 hypothetical protein N7539_007427 [Penicillium diatomitis]